MQPTQFVVIHFAGPLWDHTLSAFEQVGLQRHVEHYRTLYRDGKIVMGGPFLDEAGGGMMIATPGVSCAELNAFAAADPTVGSGLLTFTVRPWLVGMKAGPAP